MQTYSLDTTYQVLEHPVPADVPLAHLKSIWTGPMLKASGTDVSMEEMELTFEELDPE